MCERGTGGTWPLDDEYVPTSTHVPTPLGNAEVETGNWRAGGRTAGRVLSVGMGLIPLSSVVRISFNVFLIMLLTAADTMCCFEICAPPPRGRTPASPTGPRRFGYKEIENDTTASSIWPDAYLKLRLTLAETGAVDNTVFKENEIICTDNF